MESTNSANKALMHALVGQSDLALDLLKQQAQPLTFELAISKAQVQLNLGLTEEAIETLDEIKSTSDYQRWFVFQIMAKALLQSNEAKAAQICLMQADKIWAEVQK